MSVLKVLLTCTYSFTKRLLCQGKFHTPVCDLIDKTRINRFKRHSTSCVWKVNAKKVGA